MPDYPLLNNPKVEVIPHDIEPRGFLVVFIPNDACKGYYFLLGDPDPAMMGNASLRNFVVAWGGDFPSRKAHTEEKRNFLYNGLLPGTDNNLYIVMEDENGQQSDVIKYVIRTKKKGTDKEAIPTIVVSEIKDTSARITVSPDENTSTFRDALVIKEKYDNDSNTRDFIEKMFNEPESMNNPIHVDTDDFVWRNLNPDTEYYVFARAKNANDEWGTMQKKVFKTLKSATNSFQSSKPMNGLIVRLPQGKQENVNVIDIRNR